MSIYSAVISEITSRLAQIDTQAQLAGVKPIQILRIPQYRGNYKRLDNSFKARISVALWQSKFGTDQTPSNQMIGSAIADRDVFYVCTFSSRELEDDYGIYDLIDKTEQLLQGYKPAFGKELNIAGVEITDLVDNDWFYQLIVKHTGVPLIGIDNLREELPTYPGTIKEIDYEYELDSPELVTGQGEIIVSDGENLAI